MSGRTGPPRSGKVDASHNAHMDALRAAGVICRSLAMVGGGLNDVLCAVPEATFLIEIKEPGETLTPKQKDWHRECPWRNHVSYSPEMSVEIAQFYRGKQVRAA